MNILIYKLKKIISSAKKKENYVGILEVKVTVRIRFDSIYCIYVVGLFYIWSIQNADNIIETHI